MIPAAIADVNCRDASGETTKYSTNNYKDASTAGRKSPVAY